MSLTCPDATRPNTIKEAVAEYYSSLVMSKEIIVSIIVASVEGQSDYFERLGVAKIEYWELKEQPFLSVLGELHLG